MELTMIKLSKLSVSKSIRFSYDKFRFKELKTSIEIKGLLFPLVVIKNGKKLGLLMAMPESALLRHLTGHQQRKSLQLF